MCSVQKGAPFTLIGISGALMSEDTPAGLFKPCFDGPKVPANFGLITASFGWVKEIWKDLYLGGVLLCSSVFKESALGRFFHRVAMSVYVFMYLSVCPLFM